MKLDSAIDQLYQEPLSEFVSARSALAKTLSGADAARVKALKKPTIVPWAVNQVYWQARGIFDRVRKTGAAVRREQMAALSKGQAKDLKPALEAHRSAIAAAVEQALAFARNVESQPNVDAVAQTFEALSLVEETAEPFGRFSQPLRPGGFEILAGIRPGAVAHATASGTKTGSSRQAQTLERQRRDEAAARQEEKRRQAREKARAAAIVKAERELAAVTKKELAARANWEQVRDEVDRARQALSELRSGRD